ncbi:MAG: SCP2 sterol-binding domain-containing protein [Deltaproteobacteria bacterium]|jgi:putative sterol carrier protein|nr:SCP2 sterol-binding domain-containing protein [Deltaproteobacteria bacterium]MBT4527520.1 SCP2 sterol-binding domain-containing protein [Deltaproteobacteria bacterium]
MANSNHPITVQEIFQKVEKGIIKYPERVTQVNAVYLFKISGDDGGTFHLNLRKNPGISFEEKPADCILEIRDRDFIKLYKGIIQGFKAMLSGKLKVKGDLKLATHLNDIFRSTKSEHQSPSE